MKNKGFSIKAGAFCILSIATAVAVPTNVMAEDVTLKSADVTVNLTGEFIGFEDNSYTVRTPLGDLRIAASRVTCEGEACPVFEVAEADVEIAGSDTVGLGLMPLLLEGYAGYVDAAAEITNANDGNTLVAALIGDGGFGDELGSYLVQSTGSSDAFSTLLEGESQIGMSSRRIRPEEARALRDAGAGNMVSPQQEHIIAVDSLVVVTHPDNPIDTLTMQQLQQVYAGEITNWSELGGPDLAITPVSMPDGSGTRSVFESRVFEGADVTMASSVQFAEGADDIANFVNTEPGGLGYVGYAFQRGAKPITLINNCGIAMTPDAFSARTEEYALQRRLYLYNRSDVEAQQVSDFLTFASSPAADGVVAKSGFIGLGIDRKLQSLDSERARMLLDPNVDAYEGNFMRDMLAKMVDYDRLSTTFRFRTGSSKLDERGLVDMARLSDYLKSQPEGSEVLFVGFTDDVGAFDSNRDLSAGRAQQVLTELQAYAGDALAGVSMDATGYGEIAPAGCNIAEEGRRINRRVEVWIKSAG